MKIPIKKETIKAIYSMYRSVSPFCRWGLPPSEEVYFVPMRSKINRGHYDNTWEPGDCARKVLHKIRIDRSCSLEELIHTMPHEMIHLRQQRAGYSTKYKNNEDWHGKDFDKMARQVCKRFGFKLKKF